VKIEAGEETSERFIGTFCDDVVESVALLSGSHRADYRTGNRWCPPVLATAGHLAPFFVTFPAAGTSKARMKVASARIRAQPHLIFTSRSFQGLARKG
jgi:hypothetical protein